MKSLEIRVNKKTRNEFISVCDVKRLVSSTQITHNFIDPTLFRVAAGIISKDKNYIEFHIKIGRKASGDFKLHDIYLPKDKRYEVVLSGIESITISDKTDYFKGCLIKEIQSQYKLFCLGKRGRESTY